MRTCYLAANAHAPLSKCPAAFEKSSLPHLTRCNHPILRFYWTRTLIGKSSTVFGIAIIGFWLPSVSSLTRRETYPCRSEIMTTGTSGRPAAPRNPSTTALAKAPLPHSSFSCDNSFPVEEV